SVQGFAPMTAPRSALRLSASNLEDDLDLPPSSFAFDIVEEEEEEEEIFSTTKPSFKSPSLKSMPKVSNVDVEDLKVKASATFDDISTKAKDFVEDERVQEIAEKAKDFAQDVAGQLFSAMGDKLKELKKEREELKNRQE
ncbi:MAG: hypothetical protein SGILL_009447, partial [Bacillariaceae sp.]